MKLTSRFALPVAVFTAFSSVATATIERTVEKTFTVHPAGTLHLDTQGGEIRVTPGSDGMVKITAREKIRAQTEAEADELLKKLELTFDQMGDDVSARAKYEANTSGFHFGSWPPVQVDFIVTVPTAFAADLHTSGGAIVVGDLGGKLVAKTSGGGIKLGKLGSTVDAHTSGGNVALEEAHGEVKLDTSGGNINVGRVSGPAELSSSGGNIRIEAVESRLRARTNGGSIRAGIVGGLKDDCELNTSGGSVHVTVDKTAAFQLDASTSGGSVDAEGLTITLQKTGHGRSQLSGAVNGGGPLLKLRSSGGSIQVSSR
jgi:hypothetical protein